MIFSLKDITVIAFCGVMLTSFTIASPIPYTILMPRNMDPEVDWCSVEHCEPLINPICTKRSDGALTTLLNPCQLNVVNCVPEGAMFEFLHHGEC